MYVIILNVKEEKKILSFNDTSLIYDTMNLYYTTNSIHNYTII